MLATWTTVDRCFRRHPLPCTIRIMALARTITLWATTWWAPCPMCTNGTKMQSTGNFAWFRFTNRHHSLSVSIGGRKWSSWGLSVLFLIHRCRRRRHKVQRHCFIASYKSMFSMFSLSPPDKHSGSVLHHTSALLYRTIHTTGTNITRTRQRQIFD